MTIKDIATKAGVSIASVSRVINNDPSVSKPLFEKVMKVIDEVGYSPNQIGRQLRLSKSHKILVMLPTLSNAFYSLIMRGIEEKSATFGYIPLIAVTNLDKKKEEKYLELLLTKQVDGALIFFSTLSKDHIDTLAEKFPIVQCCEYVAQSKTSYVTIDNRNAAYEATSYLAQCGHQRIAMISGNYYRWSEVFRENGYKEALSYHQLSFNKEYLVKSDYTYEGGRIACEKLMTLKEPPTAIFCISDVNAIGAIKYLADVNKVAGKDIDIIGFDNSSMAQAAVPALTTVAQPQYQLGEVAVSLLMDKITDISSIDKGVTLPHQLMIRASTTSTL